MLTQYVSNEGGKEFKDEGASKRDTENPNPTQRF